MGSEAAVATIHSIFLLTLILLGLGLAWSKVAAAAGHLCTATSTTRLEVVVPNVESARGKIEFSIYPPIKDRWLAHHGQLFNVVVPAVVPVTRTCIALPAPGDYAAALYHDENNSGHLERNWIGLPKEPYGISGHPGVLLGFPSFSKALFHVAAGTTTITIKLHH